MQYDYKIIQMHGHKVLQESNLTQDSHAGRTSRNTSNLSNAAAYSERRTSHPYGGYGKRTWIICSTCQRVTDYSTAPQLVVHA